MKKLLWIFDLDNTLHDASHGIYPAITANMNAFLAEVLGQGGKPTDAATVNAVRLDYWRRYGATLLGMIKHHNIRMEAFLHAAHQFDDLRTLIRAERGVQHFLKRLPGRKILLTNAPRRYSRDIVRHLGLHRHFARHLPIESMHVHRSLRPKPSRLLLRKLLAREKVHPRHAVLIEDTVKTLKAAKSLGMRTVWVTQYLGGNPLDTAQSVSFAQLPHINRPAYVDVKVKSVRQLATYLGRLRS
ncbi:MAG: phosphoglycolate phosphatase [Oxalobacter sp.]|nr:MAG: phosphoglycolate phosphatase [Oxalobacter sp.]